MEFKGPQLQAKGESKKGFAGREPLADIMAAREPKIVVVFCDSQFEHSTRLLEDMRDVFELPPMTSINFSGLVSSQELKGDMLLINSLNPFTVTNESEALEAAIRAFRSNNPNSAVVLNSLYGDTTPAGKVLRSFEKAGLATVLDGAGISPHRMIEAGAEAIAKNAL